MKKRLFLIALVSLCLLVILVLSFKRAKFSLAIKNGSLESAAGLITQAQALEAKGNLKEAKDLYQKAINDFPGSNDVMNWQKKIEGININLLFSSTVTVNSALYEIKPGDTLAKIAKEFKTTVEFIKKSNNLLEDRINPGRKIKVWTVPFSIVVDKSQNSLILKANEEIIKTYIVSTGKNNSTPVGTFKIVNKLPRPTWFKAGAVVPAGSPENILGSCWLGFDLAGYGIHGTTDPGSLGQQVTQGCVRMSNSDVEELYIIVPMGTEVTIID